MTIETKLIDKLLEGCKSPEEIIGKYGLIKQLTKALVERALEGEMSTHLGAVDIYFSHCFGSLSRNTV